MIKLGVAHEGVSNSSFIVYVGEYALIESQSRNDIYNCLRELSCLNCFISDERRKAVIEKVMDQIDAS